MTTVSVDEALAKGRKMLIHVPMLLLFAPQIIAFYLVIQKEYSGWLIMVLFVCIGIPILGGHGNTVAVMGICKCEKCS